MYENHRVTPVVHTQPCSTVNRLFFFGIFLLACCSRVEAFPSAEQLKSKLRAGLTADEVVALFGEPNNGRVVPCIDCTFTYLPPLGSLTVKKEGYAGVRIRFDGGKVRDWHIYTGSPSYAEPKMPAAFRFWIWSFGIMFALGIVSKLLIRAENLRVWYGCRSVLRVDSVTLWCRVIRPTRPS